MSWESLVNRQKEHRKETSEIDQTFASVFSGPDGKKLLEFFDSIVNSFNILCNYSDNNIVKKEHNEKDGIFFTTTKTRHKLILEELKKAKQNSFPLDIEKIKFKEMN